MRGVGASLRALLVAALCSSFLGACAQITVFTDHQPPRTELRFGVLAVDLSGSNKNTIIQSTGLGWVSTPTGATLGYAKTRIVRLGDQCRIVVSVDDSEVLRRDPQMLDLLKRAGSACGA